MCSRLEYNFDAVKLSIFYQLFLKFKYETKSIRNFWKIFKICSKKMQKVYVFMQISAEICMKIYVCPSLGHKSTN